MSTINATNLMAAPAPRASLKSWVMALRPKTLTAALVPIIVATALVKAQGETILWWVSICALFSAFFIQIATNLFNDAIDFKKGADTEKRIGPQRVTQSGVMTSRQVMIGGGLCLFVAFLFGVPLVIHGGWPIVVIGLVSLFLGYAYTGGPFPLAYKGLGDLFVILFFGLIAVGGTYYLHTGHWSFPAMVAGLQVGCLATVLIAVNNLRDAPQDALVHKKTLAVRFGLGFARAEIMILVIAAFALGVYWASQDVKLAAILPIVSFPIARRLILGVFKNEPSPLFNTFLAMAAALHMFFGVLLAVGLWLR
jgi:1,4-dihydroxy-2-naphthoate polyprenyltransferase